MQMVIKLLRRLIEGHLRFFDLKKVEIIENTDARAHTS